MKAKIILYGWVISLIPMMAGLGTMEWAMESGEPVFMAGLTLFMVFVVFSWLVIENRDIVDKEAERFDLWCDRMFEKFGRWLDRIGLG